jgi:hypothetical protein
MDAMRAHDRPQIRQAEEDADGEASVGQPVVDDDVPRPEGAHADAEAERDVAQNAGLRPTSSEHEPDGDGSVQDRQGVVGLEAGARGPRLVMRAVDRPEPGVPHPAVKQRRPEVHRDGGRSGHRNPDDSVRERLAHGDLRGGEP